jgi:hypothetical protein
VHPGDPPHLLLGGAPGAVDHRGQGHGPLRERASKQASGRAWLAGSAGSPAGWVVRCSAGWRGRPAGWLVMRLAGWLAGWRPAGRPAGCPQHTWMFGWACRRCGVGGVRRCLQPSQPFCSHFISYLSLLSQHGFLLHENFNY